MNIKEFQEVVKIGKHLVDFYSEKCRPCKILAEFLPELESKINILKIDAVKAVDISNEYGISSVPTVIFFKDGEMVKKVIGIKSKEFYLQIIENL